MNRKGMKMHNKFTYSTLLCEEVSKVLPFMPKDRRFDVVIADPPYNIGKDFGNNKSQLSMKEYVRWAFTWIKPCMELLADEGIMYIYGFPENLAHIAINFTPERQRWLVWHYINKNVHNSSFWQRSHESILCVWKSKKRPSLEIDQIREPYINTSSHGKIRKGISGRLGNKETYFTYHKDGAMPRDVIKIPALAGGAGEKERWFMCRDCDKIYPPNALKEHREHNILKHPTQKPTRLAKHLLKSCIKGNQGSVLVPFAGSGSECVAAKQLGISYFGIEMNPEYVKIAKGWLDDCQ